MTTPLLFPKRRRCIVCDCSAPFNSAEWEKGQSSILALNLTIYRRTRSGRQLKTSKAVNVCEDCMGLVLASRQGEFTIKASLLATAVFDRAADCYSAMCEAKSA